MQRCAGCSRPPCCSADIGGLRHESSRQGLHRDPAQRTVAKIEATCETAAAIAIAMVVSDEAQVREGIARASQ